MNRLLMALAAAAFVPALAHAAQMVDPIVPGTAPDAAPTELKDESPPPRPPQNERAAQRDRDLRQQCLDLPTNKAVNACADRYKPRGAHASTAPVKKGPPSDAPKAAEWKPGDAPQAAPKPPAGKAPAEPPKTGDILKLPPLKPLPPDTSKAAAPPAKAPEQVKK